MNDPIISLDADGNPRDFQNRPLTGSGTKEDPYAVTTIEETRQHLYRHVARMREKYPSKQHPYRMAGFNEETGRFWIKIEGAFGKLEEV